MGNGKTLFAYPQTPRMLKCAGSLIVFFACTMAADTAGEAKAASPAAEEADAPAELIVRCPEELLTDGAELTTPQKNHLLERYGVTCTTRPCRPGRWRQHEEATGEEAQSSWRELTCYGPISQVQAARAEALVLCKATADAKRNMNSEDTATAEAKETKLASARVEKKRRKQERIAEHRERQQKEHEAAVERRKQKTRAIAAAQHEAWGAHRQRWQQWQAEQQWQHGYDERSGYASHASSSQLQQEWQAEQQSQHGYDERSGYASHASSSSAYDFQAHQQQEQAAAAMVARAREQHEAYNKWWREQQNAWRSWEAQMDTSRLDEYHDRIDREIQYTREELLAKKEDVKVEPKATSSSSSTHYDPAIGPKQPAMAPPKRAIQAHKLKTLKEETELMEENLEDELESKKKRLDDKKRDRENM